MKNTIVSLILLLGAAAMAQENYATWTQNRTIILNTSSTGANVAGTVTNFPTLIRLVPAESTIFAQAKAAGADIRFAKSNGTHLPYQIERWDATAKRAEIWVRLDTVYGNNSTQNIRMYWGNAGAADSSKGARVFDTASGFQGVYHLGEANDSAAKDVTFNGYNAAPGNTSGVNPFNQTAVIGNGKRLNDNLNGNGSGSYYTIANTNTAAPKLNWNANADFYTLSAWVKANSLPNTTGSAQRMGVIMKYGTASNQQYGMLGVGNGADPVSRWSGNHKSPDGEAWNEAAATAGEWQHVVVVRAGAGVGTGQGGTGLIYVNGEVSAIAPTGSASATNNGTGSDLVFGAYSNLARFLDGSIDEIVLANQARSADFIKLSYESQKTTQSFSNIGLTVPTVPSAPTSVIATPVSGGASISWTAPASNGNATITAYKAMVVGDTAKFCTSAAPTLTCTVALVPGSYTFIVKASNSVGSSVASAPSASTVVSILGNVAGRAGRQLMINSTGSRIDFQIQGEAGGKAQVSLVDMWGRTVWTHTAQTSTGMNNVSWNGKALDGGVASSGIYIVRVSLLNAANKVTDNLQRKVLFTH